MAMGQASGLLVNESSITLSPLCFNSDSTTRGTVALVRERGTKSGEQKAKHGTALSTASRSIIRGRPMLSGPDRCA